MSTSISGTPVARAHQESIQPGRINRAPYEDDLRPRNVPKLVKKN
jgi:hypothetical protein